jgi:hypothetical protein
MPAQERLRRHDQAVTAARRKDPRKRRQERTIGRPQTWPRLLPLEHPELMPQNQEFDVLGKLATSPPSKKQPQQRREPKVNEAEKPSGDAPRADCGPW